MRMLFSFRALGKTAQSRFAERNVHYITHFFHGVDYLVGWNAADSSCHCHVCTGYGIYRSDHISFDTRYFNQTGYRVTNKPRIGRKLDSDIVELN